MQQFTERALMDSFMRLLQEQPLDKITIKAVVDDCGLNRSTFYYYFDDIYALLYEILRQETEKVLKDCNDVTSWQDGLIAGMEFALQNRRAVYHIYQSVGREQLSGYLDAVTTDITLKFVRSQAKGLQVSDADLQLVVDFYKSAMLGLFFLWLQNGMKEDPTVAIKRLGRLLDGNIRAMLERAAEPDRG